MGVDAETEEVELQKREKKKKKSKRTKETEDGFEGAEMVPGETIALEGEGYGVGLGTIKKKGKKPVEDKKDGNDEDHTGEKNEKKKRRVEHREKKKEGKYEEKKEKRIKNKEHISSCPEVLNDNEVGDDKEIKGVEHCEREGISDVKERERVDKQKKKKEKKEKKFMDKEVRENKVGVDQPEEEHISDNKERERRVKQKKKEKKFMDNEVRENKVGSDYSEGGCVSDIKELEKSDKEKKKKEKREKKFKDCNDAEGNTKISRNQESRKDKDHIDVGSEENIESRNKRKSKRKNKENVNEGDSGPGNKKRDRGEEVSAVEEKRRKKKKTNLAEDFEKKGVDMEELNTENRGESMPDHSKDLKPKKSHKKVKFSGHVEVYSSSTSKDVGEEDQEHNLVRGKRFTKKEDAIIKDAVMKYIKDHALGDDGVDMVMHCQQYPALKYCWKEIGEAIPWRPWAAVYYRGHNLFERADTSWWTEEEKQLILKFYEEHGPKWKELADVIGRHSVHVKDAYRRIRQPNLKRGPWSQEEYETLFDLVNMDLRMKVFEEKKSQHGMLKDNISWSAISDRLGTRSHDTCASKWYDQLTSPMVKAGEWTNTDDFRLLDELHMLDACCEEDVDWSNLIEGRSGYVCRKRWKQMLRHIGEHGIKTFPEQVEVLAKRYCPELLEVREAVDSRPIVS